MALTTSPIWQPRMVAPASVTRAQQTGKLSRKRRDYNSSRRRRAYSAGNTLRAFDIELTEASDLDAMTTRPINEVGSRCSVPRRSKRDLPGGHPALRTTPIPLSVEERAIWPIWICAVGRQGFTQLLFLPEVCEPSRRLTNPTKICCCCLSADDRAIAVQHTRTIIGVSTAASHTGCNNRRFNEYKPTEHIRRTFLEQISYWVRTHPIDTV